MLSNSGVKLTVLGDLRQFDKDIREKVKKASKLNKKNFKINLIMAINYGARQEITNAVQKVCKKLLLKKIALKQVTQQEIASNLYTKNIVLIGKLLKNRSFCHPDTQMAKCHENTLFAILSLPSTGPKTIKISIFWYPESLIKQLCSYTGTLWVAKRLRWCQLSS